jgi:hypothetical protein
MTTSRDDDAPTSCSTPESHPDGCACVRPGEEAALPLWLPQGLREQVLGEVDRIGREMLLRAQRLFPDRPSDAMAEWASKRETDIKAGLVFERGVDLDEDRVETDDELRARVRARLGGNR